MKQYNPNIHHRHSIRLKGYDYSQEGLYFITICTQNHKHLFGEIKNVPHVGTVGAGSACPKSNINIPQMILNPYGEIIQQCYWDLEHKYPNIECCEYVIMPNHFHAIIKIDRDAFGAGEPRPCVIFYLLLSKNRFVCGRNGNRCMNGFRSGIRRCAYPNG